MFEAAPCAGSVKAAADLIITPRPGPLLSQSESFSVKYPAILGSVALGTGVTDIEPALKKLTK